MGQDRAEFAIVLNEGTRSPFVARTVFQAMRLLDWFELDEPSKESVLKPLWGVMTRLVACDRIAAQLRADVERECGRFDSAEPPTLEDGRTIAAPHIIDLQGRVDRFLQGAKLALKDTAGLLRPLCGQDFDHNFRRVLLWAESEPEPDVELIAILKRNAGWIKSLIDKRNAVEHPHDRLGGTLVVENMKMLRTNDGLRPKEPVWFLTGEAEQAIVPEMEEMAALLLQFSEELLVALLKSRCQPLLEATIAEIPEDDRDPSAPVRFRVESRLR